MAKRVVYEGDSLTAGTGLGSASTERFSALVADALVADGQTWTTNNISTASDTLTDMEGDVATELTPLYNVANTNLLILWGGTNDLHAGDDGETVYNRLRTYVEDRVSEGWEVWVLSCIARDSATAGYETERLDFNARLRATWVEFADGFIDLAALPEFQDFDDLTYYQNDGIHITAAGQEIVADMVFENVYQFSGGIGMAAASNYSENTILDEIFQSGLLGATLYIGLSTADPGESAATLAEPSGNNYARVGKAAGSTHWNAAASGVVTNKTQITFPTASGSWGTLAYWAIFDASSGGNMLFYGALASSQAVGNGQAPSIAAEGLSIGAD